jgi:hydroxymethylpyrimidine/phosphomethylpyrimidine kinase
MPPKHKSALPIVLSIGGYDPSSGAGITADIKTIAAHRCYGITCITALTVQSTRGVKRVEQVDSRVITETLEELVTDLPIAGVRIGMLGSAEAARAVVAFLRRNEPPCVVLDPILKSSSGADLISRDGVQVLREKLLPLADVITPNIDEAAALTGIPVKDTEGMEAAAAQLHKMGARNVVITGGHLNPPVDLVSLRSGGGVKLLEGERISGSSTHGTGCAFATSMACNLAQGENVTEAARAAKLYVANAIKKALDIGKGTGPVNHLYKASSF